MVELSKTKIKPIYGIFFHHSGVPDDDPRFSTMLQFHTYQWNATE